MIVTVQLEVIKALPQQIRGGIRIELPHNALLQLLLLPAGRRWQPVINHAVLQLIIHIK